MIFPEPTFKNGSAFSVSAKRMLMNSSGSFSSDVSPLIEHVSSSISRNLSTRSARTKVFCRSGLTISSRRTVFTAS